MKQVYQCTSSEKRVVMMRKISDYTTKGSMEAVTDNLKTMVKKARRIKLKYHFRSGHQGDKINLRNKIGTKDGDPRGGYSVEISIKSLNNMNIHGNRISSFKKEDKLIYTIYVENR